MRDWRGGLSRRPGGTRSSVARQRASSVWPSPKVSPAARVSRPASVIRTLAASTALSRVRSSQDPCFTSAAIVRTLRPCAVKSVCVAPSGSVAAITMVPRIGPKIFWGKSVQIAPAVDQTRGGRVPRGGLRRTSPLPSGRERGTPSSVADSERAERLEYEAGGKDKA